jgi:hypothetical protein
VSDNTLASPDDFSNTIDESMEHEPAELGNHHVESLWGQYRLGSWFEVVLGKFFV